MATDVNRIVSRVSNLQDKPIAVDHSQQQGQNAGLPQGQPNQNKSSAEPQVKKYVTAVELAASLSALKVGDILAGKVEYQQANGRFYIVTDRGTFALPPDIHLNANETVSLEITNVDKVITAVLTIQPGAQTTDKTSIPNVELIFVELPALQPDQAHLIKPELQAVPETAHDVANLVKLVADYFSNLSNLTDVSAEIILPAVTNTAPADSYAEAASVVFGGSIQLQGSSLADINSPQPIAVQNDLVGQSLHNIDSSTYRGVLTAWTGNTEALPDASHETQVTLLAILPETESLPHVQPGLLGGASLPLTSLVNSGRAILATVVDHVDETHVVILLANQPDAKQIFHASKSTIADLRLNARLVILTEHGKSGGAEKSRNVLAESESAKTRLHFSLMNEAFATVLGLPDQGQLVAQLPTPGAKLSAQIIFMLYALKVGKFYPPQLQEKASQPAAISRFIASIENLAARAAASSEAHEPQSRTTILPLRFGDTLVPLTIITTDMYDENKNSHADREKNDNRPTKQFEVSINFKSLGCVKMTGRLTENNLDLKITSDQDFPNSLKATTREVFISALAHDALSGSLSFQS